MDYLYNINKTSILIVEDSRTQATILQHLLESAGYQISCCYNGKEAINFLKHTKPTLILSDIVMPEMDGYDLCYTIKQNPDTSMIPVILVTQLYDPQDVIKGLECGADNFIIKPYESQYLLSRIEVILANRFLQMSEPMNLGIEVFFAGKKHFITSNRLQILNILLSTYEIAIQKNNELLEIKNDLSSLNDQLCDANDHLKRVIDELNNEILERKRVETALFQTNKKLNLLSSITRHDIKNILMAILGYHGLASQDVTDDSFKRYLARESDLFAKLTNQIEFTRLYEELGSSAPSWKPLREIKKIAFPGSNQVNLIINPETESFEIFCDPLIDKVFYNLFENSVRHGGTVTSISVNVVVNNELLQIRVCDDGNGISPEDKDQIFKKGYGKNTGLGLFLVREILSITNITIDARHNNQKGACFEMVVPSEHFRSISS